MSSADCSGLTVGGMVALGYALAAQHPGADVHLDPYTGDLIWEVGA